MKHILFIIFFSSLCYAEYEKFVLIIPLYNEQHPYRIEEYLTCLKKNLQHPDIEKIHVLYDSSGSKVNQKILSYIKKYNIPISYVDKRQTFHDLFTIAREYYPHRNVIVSNADIYFNHTLSKLSEVNLESLFVALTVWDVKQQGKMSLRMKNGKIPAYDSMDTWIFKSPLPQFELEEIEIGTMTCENRIAYYAEKAGLKLFNPCLSVQACHLHISKIRNQYGRKYTKATDRRGIKACTIEGILHHIKK